MYTCILQREGEWAIPPISETLYTMGIYKGQGGVSLFPCKWNFVYNRHFFSHHKQLAMMLWLWSFEVSLPAKAPPNSVEPCSIPHWPHPLLVRVCVPETKQKSTWKSHLNEGFFYWLTAKMVTMLLCSRCFSSMGMEKSNNIKSKKNSKIVQRTLYAHVHCISTHAAHKLYEPKSL